MRQLSVYQQAIEFVPEICEKYPPQETDNPELKEHSEVWIESFNEYVRKHIEKWREELFAKALALEITQPGTLNHQTLWYIGTMEKSTFDTFASLLDTVIKISINHLLPDALFFKEQIPESTVYPPNSRISNHMAILKDSGLIADENISISVNFLDANYGEHKFQACSATEVYVGKPLLTPLGNNIAKLYNPKTNHLGLKIFEHWKAQIRSKFENIILES